MFQGDPEELLRTAQRHHQQGNLSAAESIYREILSQFPEHAQAMHLLGLVYYQSGDPPRALGLMRKSIELRSDVAFFYLNLGTVHRSLGNYGDAVSAFKKAIELHNFAGAWYGLGQTYDKAGDAANAMQAFRKTIEMDPNDAGGHLNLGVFTELEGRYDEADEMFRKALELKPDYPHAHVAMGVSLLRRRQLAEGWAHYEWRLRHPKFNSVKLDPAYPVWDGSDLNGRTIVVRAEQGVGDTMLFARFIPELLARGGHVVLQLQPALEMLFRQSDGYGTIVTSGDAMPLYDVQLPMMSLPKALGHTALEQLATKAPYLTANPNDIETWRRELAGETNLKVGLAWAGNPKNPNDKARSARLETLAALASVPEVTFYSIQYGAPAEQAKTPPEGMKLVDLSSRLKDLTDTAAVLTQLDLLIAVDTAVVHLAGALGRPVWTLLPYVPDWRWFKDGQDTVWHSTMRLFRQTRLNDWTEPVGRVTDALRQLAAAQKVRCGIKTG